MEYFAGLDVSMEETRLVRVSDACQRLMTIPGVGQLTALPFAAAVDAPSRFRRSRDRLLPLMLPSSAVRWAGAWRVS